ncbi:transglutaminase-like domain-containing protein [Deefgea rivuli]|uniref:transglutaminase-like domain-containing protein n=1 Tax=Deefgea rivuli TaxID=400948 RepID=UPI000685BECC|nr:transglutaminase-like domain-containing protein [Deefgea rivuli]
MKDEYLLGSHELLQPTKILDFHAQNIRALVDERGWRQRNSVDAARAVYEFCREEILFGYNSDADDMQASRVLSEGIGHCNTKATLLMALLRSVGIPCRLNAFTIKKSLQRGALTPFVYFMAPHEIIHTWTEAKLGNQWVALEGLILDSGYLEAVQHRFVHCSHPFLGYAIATENLQRPRVEWTGSDTFIQRDGIARELGIFQSPDAFYEKHSTNLQGIKGWLYRNYFYKRLNENISNIRSGSTQPPIHEQQCNHYDVGR